MRCGANWIPHVVEAVEDRHEVILFTWELLGFRHLERDPVRHPLTLGGFPRRLNGLVMVVKSIDVGLGEGFRHQDGGSAFPAAHVGDLGTAREFVLDPIESRNPGADQIRGVPWTKELLASVKHPVLVLAPGK